MASRCMGTRPSNLSGPHAVLLWIPTNEVEGEEFEKRVGIQSERAPSHLYNYGSTEPPPLQIPFSLVD